MGCILIPIKDGYEMVYELLFGIIPFHIGMEMGFLVARGTGSLFLSLFLGASKVPNLYFILHIEMQ